MLFPTSSASPSGASWRSVRLSIGLDEDVDLGHLNVLKDRALASLDTHSVHSAVLPSPSSL